MQPGLDVIGWMVSYMLLCIQVKLYNRRKSWKVVIVRSVSFQNKNESFVRKMIILAHIYIFSFSQEENGNKN